MQLWKVPVKNIIVNSRTVFEQTSALAVNSGSTKSFRSPPHNQDMVCCSITTQSRIMRSPRCTNGVTVKLGSTIRIQSKTKFFMFCVWNFVAHFRTNSVSFSQNVNVLPRSFKIFAVCQKLLFW